MSNQSRATEDQFNAGAPSWLRVSIKRNTVQLRGDSTWAGQPVVNTVRVRLRDGLTGVNVNQAMAASWRFNGNGEKNRFVFGDQAGAITKRTRSVMNFGNDQRQDVFVFTNTAPGKPFNHMQQFTIQNMGREDRIILKNIGRTFGFNDVRGDGSLPGVPVTNLRITSFAT